jgi:hypothetical protein
VLGSDWVERSACRLCREHTPPYLPRTIIWPRSSCFALCSRRRVEPSSFARFRELSEAELASLVLVGEIEAAWEQRRLPMECSRLTIVIRPLVTPFRSSIDALTLTSMFLHCFTAPRCCSSRRHTGLPYLVILSSKHRNSSRLLSLIMKHPQYPHSAQIMFIRPPEHACYRAAATQPR